MNNQIDLNTIMGYMVMIMMIGMMMKVMTRELKPAAERPLIYGPRGEVLTHHSSSEVRRLGEPRSEEERARVHEEFYGTGELPVRGTGLSERGESAEGRGLGEPKTEEERGETHLTRYGSKRLPERGKGREEYYWEITDIETGEIIQRGKPYTSVSRVYAGARSYQRASPGGDKEHTVVIRIFDDPNMEEWGKTVKPVMESGMRRGIPILIGKTPLQEEALDRLWPYGVLEIHDDGDLTISSAGKKYVVTTEGGVFIHYTGEEALGRTMGGE